MKAEGIAQPFGNIDTFVNQPLLPYKNFLRTHVEKITHPLMAHYHWKNLEQLKQVIRLSFLVVWASLITEISLLYILTMMILPIHLSII